MRRFKNILVVYDLTPGSDETLQRAVELAQRNQARLTIVNMLDPRVNDDQVASERDRTLARVIAGIGLPEAQKSGTVLLGPPAQGILDQARSVGADLIVTSDMSSGYYKQLLGLDVTSDVLRQADCPVWVVRSTGQKDYQRIVASVNAGKENALACPANRRILEIGSSLAALENAQMDVVYVWDFDDAERDMMTSELPPGKFVEQMEALRLTHLDKLVSLLRHVLGDSFACTPVPIRGQKGDAIITYMEACPTDLLIADGKIGNPFLTALVQSTSMHLLRQSSCSVLFTKPLVQAQPSMQEHAA